MERPFTLLFSGLLAWGSAAQSGPHTGRVAEHMNTLRQAGVDFREIPLFTDVQRSATSDALWQAEVTRATVVRLDRSATAMLLGARNEHISLTLPAEIGTVTVDLERVDITTEDFQVTQASTGMAADVEEGLHYRGMIRGAEGSMAAISIFPDEVMGLMSDAQGERILGRFANDMNGDHVFYREQDLRGTSGAVCGTADVDMSDDQGAHGSEITDRTVKCVRFYWEVNYDIFQGKGSVANAANYVTGLFNQSAILYANDGISVVLSEVFVWDVASPYTSSSTSTQLSTFGTTRTSFNGDLAHLLGYTGGGGVAFVNTICSSQTRYRMAYSDINSSYSNVPTYSWSVEVVTHEQGHNMGSSHTHACAWNGNNTAIDGCGPAAGYTEGSCAQGPLPPSNVGGTIMSYCHLTSSGINFANGFGPQPAALIISRVNGASCLTNCSTTTCGVPTNLAAGSITSTSASLSWTGVPGAASYTLQWKPTSSSTWTSVSGIAGTSHVLSGLSAGTAYHFQVLTVCSGSSSGYATAVSFTTGSAATCNVPGGLAASSITSGSAALSWVAVSGASSYHIQWKTSAGSTWTTVSSVAATSYSLTGLSASTAYQFQVRTNCASGNSAYSAATSFTTSAPACSDVYEPNNSRNNGSAIAVNTTLTGRIASQYDQDWYRFSNTTASRNVRVTLSGLPANYRIDLYNNATLVGSSNVSGTGNETIVYNTTTVSTSYYVRVAGVSGAYNATACYTLNVQTGSTSFMVEGTPEGTIEGEINAIGNDLGHIFPNPAYDHVNISIPASHLATTIQLYDISGRVVGTMDHPGTTASGNVVLYLTGQPSGAYLVRISRGGESKVHRLVIGH
ncbi:MAG: fibronectin type III domain-containing protein [Flavobacteriales bacterium]|nr:fibronectin type III domain-containing protein [Flavobacteriales bacterium]